MYLCKVKYKRKEMKRLLFCLIALCFSLSCFAQMDISYGKRFYDIKDNCQDVKIIAEDMTGYYFYYCLNEYKGEGEFELNYYVAHCDLNGNVDKIVKIDFTSKKFKIENTWRNGQLVGFILSKTKTDKPVVSRKTNKRKAEKALETGKQSLYTEYFHLKDMRLIGTPEKFVSYSYFADSAQSPYLFKFSENKTKMVFCFFVNDTTGRAANIKVYDSKMNMLWDKNYPLNFNSSYEIKDIAIDNDGKRALLAIKGYQKGKKVKHTEDVIHLVYLTQYQKKEHTLQLEKAWPTDMKCCFNMEGDYMVAGYYGISSEKPYLSAGSFSYLFDQRRFTQKNASRQDFKEYETDDMTPKDMAKPSSFSTYIDDIVPMIGGNVIMIGEQRFYSKVIPGKRKGDKPTGENAQYFRDIAITNIDNTGLITGNAFIAKRQKDNNGNNDYNSYQITRDRYGLYIMFNDHIANYNDGKYSPSKEYDSDKLRTQVNFVQIYSDGSYNWQKAFQTHSSKMPFFKTLYLTTTKNIIFLNHFEDNNIIGKFQTR
jgi:hypothetical protein